MPSASSFEKQQTNRSAYFENAMNKRELADRLAKEAHKSRAKAADDVDSLVYGLLKDMRDSAKVPADKPEIASPKPPFALTPVVKKASGNKK